MTQHVEAVNMVASRPEMTRAPLARSCPLREEDPAAHLQSEIEDLAAAISHSLRSPAWALESFTAAALRRGERIPDPDTVKFMERVMSCAQAISGRLDSILAIREAARRPHPFGRIDLSALARDCVHDLRQDNPDRRVIVEIADGLQAMGDRARVRQLLAVILENAWKFTAPKPVAEVTLGELPESAARAVQPFPERPAACGAKKVFFVRDNGIGYDEAFYEKLFSPFQRLHPQDEFDGPGIGLSVARRIVHLHKGRIWSEGRPGEGAAFYFSLPAAD